MGDSPLGKGESLALDDHYLMPICRGNVIVFCSEVGCSHNEIHMKVGVIILF